MQFSKLGLFAKIILYKNTHFMFNHQKLLTVEVATTQSRKQFVLRSVATDQDFFSHPHRPN